MADIVQQAFVRSFIEYLKKQIDTQTFTPDAQESCELSIQCIQAAFGLCDEDAEVQTQITSAPGKDTAATSTSSTGSKEVQLFDLFEMHCLERNPDTLKIAEAIKNEGNRLMKDGKYNEALLQYNRAITYDAKNTIYYCNRAAAYLRLGDNNTAITDCKSALVYKPNYGKAYARLGIAYTNLGKYEEAQQAYEKAIEVEPDNVAYRDNLERLRNFRNHDRSNLQENLNAMIPVVRNLFNNTEMGYLQLMAQNPVLMNCLCQLFRSLQPSTFNENHVQTFQNFVQQLTGAAEAIQSMGSGNNSSSNEDQPPPSSS